MNIHNGTVNISEYSYDLKTYLSNSSLFFVLYAADAAGNIVVAIDIDIVKGSLAIGSAAVKYPIKLFVKKTPIIIVDILYITISASAVIVTGIEKKINCLASFNSSLLVKLKFSLLFLWLFRALPAGVPL